MLKIVNQTVRPWPSSASATAATQITKIIAYIDEHDTIEGAPGLRTTPGGVRLRLQAAQRHSRFIPYQAHIRMMAAVQPFLSGAISKTVNMPDQATVEQIAETYLEGWRLGLKASPSTAMVASAASR
jgi:ribonucleoside-diphosphate reductase alpha chain